MKIHIVYQLVDEECDHSIYNNPANKMCQDHCVYKWLDQVINTCMLAQTTLAARIATASPRYSEGAYQQEWGRLPPELTRLE